MQKPNNVPYKVQSLNPLTNEIIIRSFSTVEEASDLARHLAKLGYKNTSWGWCNKELNIVESGTISVL